MLTFPDVLFQDGSVLELDAPAAGGTVRAVLPLRPIPGDWGPKRGQTAGPLVCSVAVQLVPPANFAGVAISADLRSGPGVSNELDPVWRLDDTQAATAAGVWLRAAYQPLPAISLEVAITYGALAGNSGFRLTWTVGAAPTLITPAPRVY